MFNESRYKELARELEKSFDAPFCGNLFAHINKTNSIKDQIKKEFKESEVLAYELEHNSRLVATARVHNIFHYQD